MIALPLVGVGFLALGLVADGSGWWATRPFLTNLVSGATSACFGIPFALLVLASFTEYQAQQVQRRNAENLFDGALGSLTSWVLRVTSSASHNRLDVALDASTRRILHLIVNGRSSTNGAELADALSALEDLLTGGFSFLVDMEEHWASTRAQWRFLNDHVKASMYEQQLGWIRSDAAARFDTVLSGPNPFLSVIRLREQLLPRLIKRLSGRTDGPTGSLRPLVRDQLRELRDALVELRGELPRAMRLREALAIAHGQQFDITLVPGWGLRL